MNPQEYIEVLDQPVEQSDYMKHPYYKGKSKEDLRKAIDNQIHETEVE